MGEERKIFFKTRKKNQTSNFWHYLWIGDSKFQIPLQILFFGQQAENNFLHLLTDQNCRCSPLRRILDVEFFWLKKNTPFATYINKLQEEMSGSVSLQTPHKIQFFDISPAWSSQVSQHSVTQWIYLITIILDNPELAEFLYAQG